MESLILEEEDLQDELLTLIRMDAEIVRSFIRGVFHAESHTGREEGTGRVMKEALKDACEVRSGSWRLACRSLELGQTAA